MMEKIISLEKGFKTTSGLLYLCDKNLFIRRLNKTGCKWFGITNDEINRMGRAFTEKYFHPDTLNYEFPKIISFYQNDNNEKQFISFQKIKNPLTNEFNVCLALIKHRNNKNDFLGLTYPVSANTAFQKKLIRIFEEQIFKEKNKEIFTRLTVREKQILTQLAQGFNNPQIADNLFISRSTVEQHRKNINRKLCIKSFRDIIDFAQAFNLI
jgi:DNA-binding CsgD family transcriptional regulator